MSFVSGPYPKGFQLMERPDTGQVIRAFLLPL